MCDKKQSEAKTQPGRRERPGRPAENVHCISSCIVVRSGSRATRLLLSVHPQSRCGVCKAADILCYGSSSLSACSGSCQQEIMLRSLKNSLKSGKKGTSSSPKEEAQTAVPSSKQQSSSSAKQPAQPAKQQGQAVKEKPPLPVISEQNLQLYYAEPLPSFRECTVMWLGLPCAREALHAGLLAQHRSLACPARAHPECPAIPDAWHPWTSLLCL